MAAFNAGFLMSNANGGYYTDGKTIMPLRNGAASFVIYRNGSANIADWGRDAALTPGVVSVRQNLDLLVDHGKPVTGLNPNDTTQWGYTLGNAVYVWRSGVGITADGALVYVGGPGLNITTLADILVRAGAVRAMELDINTDWVNFATYHPDGATAQAAPANGTDLLPGMYGQPRPVLRVVVVTRLLHHVGQDPASRQRETGGRMTRTPSAGARTRGYLRAEVLAAAAQAVVLLAVAGFGSATSTPAVGSLLTGALIVPRTWKLLRDAVRVLMEATPEGVDPAAVSWPPCPGQPLVAGLGRGRG